MWTNKGGTELRFQIDKEVLEEFLNVKDLNSLQMPEGKFKIRIRRKSIVLCKACKGTGEVGGFSCPLCTLRKNRGRAR